MGDFAYFGIIESFDKNKNYSIFEVGESFTDVLERYHCVAVPDDILNDWVDSLSSTKTYFHKFNRPGTAFARTGVTLIPPESLAKFIEVITQNTQHQYFQDDSTNVSRLLDILALAQKENKFIIHYGV